MRNFNYENAMLCYFFALRAQLCAATCRAAYMNVCIHIHNNICTYIQMYVYTTFLYANE